MCFGFLLKFKEKFLIICIDELADMKSLNKYNSGMSSDMCDQLTAKYSIFLTRDGRISLAGLNEGNIEYVAKAIHDVTDGKSITS